MSIDPNSGDAAAIIVTAQDAMVAPEQIARGALFAVPVSDDSRFEIIDTEAHAASPYAKRGNVNLHEQGSLIHYVKDHHGNGTALYADIDKNTVVAVLNGHAASWDGGEEFSDQPGWGDHRAWLNLRLTPEWKRWATHDGKAQGQEAFAEFIEDSVADIVDPSGATMLELAQTFEAKKDVAFRSQTRLSDGQRQLTYTENIEARGGSGGQLAVPSQLELGISPYEGGQPYKITARLRFRLGGEGKLTIGYILDRPDDILRAAFNDVVGEIETDTGIKAFRGVAPAPLR